MEHRTRPMELYSSHDSFTSRVVLLDMVNDCSRGNTRFILAAGLEQRAMTPILTTTPAGPSSLLGLEHV